MHIRFWGVRGSIATPLTNAELKSKIESALKLSLKAGLNHEKKIPEFVENLPAHIGRTAGGDTACVEIQSGKTRLILDAGTGIRRLGLEMLKESAGRPIKANILMTHTHWDHISGIPFFGPGVNPKNEFVFYSPFDDLKDRLERQQSHEFFPAPLSPAYTFIKIEEKKPVNIDDLLVESLPLNHPDGSFSYRITSKNKTIVYATDSEYQDLSVDSMKPFTDFFKNADLLIFDAQYTMLENVEKENWGHSNVFIGIDLALEAKVRRLVFIHHEPTYDDDKLWGILLKAREYLEINQPESELQLFLATEGLSFKV